MKKEAYLQISFAWLFAIIVGAVILFLAVFATTKIVKTERTAIDAKTAKEIGVLLNPLETGFETGKSNSLSLPAETRIYNKCSSSGAFGRQIIKVSQKSFNEWTDTDVNVGFSNKYIFSGEYAEGRKFHLFSKPFKFPFKVADLIYLTSSEEKYCFFNAPEKIKDEISALGQKNLILENCSGSEEAAMVCFGFANKKKCDVNVNYNSKYVEKGKKKMYFEEDSLMYAAIFADPLIYECQLKRLMKRAGNLALIYKDKAEFVSRTGCNSNLKSDLLILGNMANSLTGSAQLVSIKNIAETIKEKNSLADCKLW